MTDTAMHTPERHILQRKPSAQAYKLHTGKHGQALTLGNTAHKPRPLTTSFCTSANAVNYNLSLHAETICVIESLDATWFTLKSAQPRMPACLSLKDD